MKPSTVYRKAAELVDGANMSCNNWYSCLAIEWVVKHSYEGAYCRQAFKYKWIFDEPRDHRDLQYKLMDCGRSEHDIRVMCLLMAAAAVDDL